jgi:hypothetical protein
VVLKSCDRVGRNTKGCSVLQVKIAGSLEVGVAGFICTRGRLLCRITRRVRSIYGSAKFTKDAAV